MTVGDLFEYVSRSVPSVSAAQLTRIVASFMRSDELTNCPASRTPR